MRYQASVERPDAIGAVQVELRIDGVLCATIALALPQSLEPVRVAAFSVEEAAQGGAEAWGASELFTFRCLDMQSLHELLVPDPALVADPDPCLDHDHNPWPRPWPLLEPCLVSVLLLKQCCLEPVGTELVLAVLSLGHKMDHVDASRTTQTPAEAARWPLLCASPGNSCIGRSNTRDRRAGAVCMAPCQRTVCLRCRAVSAVSMRALLHFRERGEKAAMAAYAATKATTAVIRCCERQIYHARKLLRDGHNKPSRTVTAWVPSGTALLPGVWYRVSQPPMLHALVQGNTCRRRSILRPPSGSPLEPRRGGRSRPPLPRGCGGGPSPVVVRLRGAAFSCTQSLERIQYRYGWLVTRTFPVQPDTCSLRKYAFAALPVPVWMPHTVGLVAVAVLCFFLSQP